LQRHGISRLPETQGNKTAKRKFKSYAIGYFHLDIAEVRTEEGELYLFVVTVSVRGGMDASQYKDYVLVLLSSNTSATNTPASRSRRSPFPKAQSYKAISYLRDVSKGGLQASAAALVYASPRLFVCSPKAMN
jgi:hypothetical protein